MNNQIDELKEENRVLMNECDRLIKEKGELLRNNEAMRKLLHESLPVLRYAFFAHYTQQNAANELCDKITEILGREQNEVR